MAGNYAALLSLARSLHNILELGQYIDPHTKEKIASLHVKVDWIITFLEDYSDEHRGPLHLVRKEIREAAYEVQDFMDTYLYSLFRTKYNSSSLDEYNCDEVSLDRGLNMAFERVQFIWEEAMKLKNSSPAKDIRSRSHSSPGDDSSSVEIAGKSMVVGFEDDLNAIKERLYDDSTKLHIVPIVGMGGIGKTTLARKAYDDSLIDQHFDICKWITVSQEHHRRDILSELLEDFDEESEAQLAKRVYQKLIGRRFLVVIDDIWSSEAWDELKMLFPDDGSGSRILLTTRLSDVAIHAGSTYAELHQMKFLNEDQSWELLRERVFGKESCPLQLVKIGKKIARNCGGLPLTIVVIAGLILSLGNKEEEGLWETISEKISFTEPTIALHCSKILYLSYDWLPLRLKPCFLYITSFPEDSKILVSHLVRLWIAEGFIKQDHQSNCLEELGERYLEDFLNRNLLSVAKKRRGGKLKYVGVHDLLREICINKAEEEGFFNNISKMNTQKNNIENPIRRLQISGEQNFEELQKADSTVRSAMLFSKTRLEFECRRLNVLHAPRIIWLKFSDAISTFVNLRYICITLRHESCAHRLPMSISKLFNLETLYARTSSRRFKVPFKILKMPKLRHFFVEPSFVLSHPSNIEVIESDLQTLGQVKNFKFTEEAIKLLVNTKKMGLVLEYSFWDDLCLDNLFYLQNLEELHVMISRSVFIPSRIWKFAFPISLRMLRLYDVCLPWDKITIIGSLPNLQVLEIYRNRAKEVSEWMPIEGQFLELKSLQSTFDHLVRWEVEKEHFPSLESLILEKASSIPEIPHGIGEIDTLQLIELRNCKKSLVNSAKRIRKQQRDNGNNVFRVRIF